MLSGEYLEEFDHLLAKGMAAKNEVNHDTALQIFETATQFAIEHGDRAKCLEALQPAATTLWEMGLYDEAADKLEAASKVAERLDLQDENGMIISKMGRVAAVKTVRIFAVESQETMLLAEAVPRFEEAYNILKNQPQAYSRYTNAYYGAVVAALSGNRNLAIKLLREGVNAALRLQRVGNEQGQDYISISETRHGLIHFLAAAALLPMGSHTPLLAKIARDKLVC